MKSLISTSIAACFAFSAGLAMAQTDKAAMKKDMATTQDCKEHTNEMKGQKRTDPPTAGTTAKCGEMKGGNMGTDKMKSGSGSNKGTSGTTPATGTGTTSGTSSGATGTGPSTPTK